MSNQAANQDCPICRTGMDVLSYEENTTGADVPVNETILRLECGHAFHSTCIALSLRQGLACPLCRRRPTLNQEDDIFIELARPLEEETEVIRISGNLIQEIDDDTKQFDNIRMHAPNVQYARASFNKQKRKYNEYVQELTRERKKYLENAMDDFREKHKELYKHQEQKLRQKIRYVQNAEYKALHDAYGRERAQALLERYPYMYNLDSVMNHPEPTRRKFWRLNN